MQKLKKKKWMQHFLHFNVLLLHVFQDLVNDVVVIESLGQESEPQQEQLPYTVLRMVKDCLECIREWLWHRRSASKVVTSARIESIWTIAQANIRVITKSNNNKRQYNCCLKMKKVMKSYSGFGNGFQLSLS